MMASAICISCNSPGLREGKLVSVVHGLVVLTCSWKVQVVMNSLSSTGTGVDCMALMFSSWISTNSSAGGISFSKVNT